MKGKNEMYKFKLNESESKIDELKSVIDMETRLKHINSSENKAKKKVHKYVAY